MEELAGKALSGAVLEGLALPVRVPVSTYRLQFNRDFTFRQAREICDYLRDLGISDPYASPLFKAGPRSTDVVAGGEGAVVVRVDRECMNKLFGYYPELREQFESVHHARVLESGFAVAEAQQEESFRETISRVLKDVLIPW